MMAHDFRRSNNVKSPYKLGGWTDHTDTVRNKSETDPVSTIYSDAFLDLNRHFVKHKLIRHLFVLHGVGGSNLLSMLREMDIAL